MAFTNAVCEREGDSGEEDEGGMEKEREGGREGGKEGRREGGKEGRREHGCCCVDAFPLRARTLALKDLDYDAEPQKGIRWHQC